MSYKKMLIVAFAGVALIMAAVIAGIAVSSSRRISFEVEFPQYTEYTPEVQATEFVDDGLDRVQVTSGTVQSVIKMLSRPESYSENISVTKYWGGGSTQYSVEKYVYSGVVRLIITCGGTVKNVIVGAESAHVWYGSENEVYSYSIGAAAGDERRVLADEYGMLLTYEDILKSDPESIFEAGYVSFNGENCIYVSAAYGEMGYTADYYVSADTGLLISAEVKDGTDVIYSMKENGCDTSVPSADYFTLPDGVSVIFSE